MIIGHGGNIYALARELGCDPDDITDMSSNVNPCGALPGIKGNLAKRLAAIESLPEADAGTITRRFADCHGVAPENVMPGNGSTQLLYALPRALDTRRALIVGPTYADYASACRQQGVEPDWFLAKEVQDFQPDLDRLAALVSQYDTVFICNPINPTGTLVPPSDLTALFHSRPDTLFVVDESYLPFAKDPELSPGGHYGDLPNVVRMTSLSKIFKIPGLRIGFAVAREGLIKKMQAFAMPWSVNSLACDAVIYILQDRSRADHFVRETQLFLQGERDAIKDHFKDNPHIRWYPSDTSFMLARLAGMHTAEGICSALAQRQILIRNCSNFEGLSERYLRVSLKGGANNQRLCRVLTEALEAG